MLTRFDWFSFIVPFGISDIFNLQMKLYFDPKIINSGDQKHTVLTACVKNEKHVYWEKWRKEFYYVF